MTLADIIEEVGKVNFGYRTVVLNKLKVANGILKEIKELKYLTEPTPPQPEEPEEPEEPPRKFSETKVDPMPKGG